MPTFLVVLSLMLATVALGAVSGGGIALAVVLAIIAVVVGVVLSATTEESITASSR